MSKKCRDTLGQIAYQEYCHRSVDRRDHNGNVLPEWWNLGAAARRAWNMAVDEAVKEAKSREIEARQQDRL